jgi:hypothetical protein
MNSKGFNNLNFGPYAASFTTKDDVTELFELYNEALSLEGSKRDSLFTYRPDTLAENISNGLFIKIVRTACDENEYQQLGEKGERIVAATGATLLDTRSIEGFPQRIPTELAKHRGRITSYPMDIGMAVSIHSRDIPNADGERPERCFFKFMMAATAMNLFRLAGDEVGGKPLDFDSFVCSIENKLGSRPMMKWLMSQPLLGWNLVVRPSEQLETSNANILACPVEFKDKDKFFFELSPGRLPEYANYLLDCWSNNRVVSEHAVEKHTVHIDINFDQDMINFLNAVRTTDLIKPNDQTGYRDLRRRLYVPELTTARHTEDCVAERNPFERPRFQNSVAFRRLANT